MASNFFKSASAKLIATPNSDVVKMSHVLTEIDHELNLIFNSGASIPRSFKNLSDAVYNSKMCIAHTDVKSYNKNINLAKMLSIKIIKGLPDGKIHIEAGLKGAELPDSFWIQYVYMCKRLNVDPYNMAAVIYLESSFNPAAQSGAHAARGFNQYMHDTAVDGFGMSEELWKNFAKLSPEESLKWTELYFRKMGGGNLRNKDMGSLYALNIGNNHNPDGSMYASLAVQKEYIKQHPGAVFKKPQDQENAIRSNPSLVEGGRITHESVTKVMSGKLADVKSSGIKARIDKAIESVGNSEPPPFVPPSKEWKPDGTEQTTTAPQATTVQVPTTGGYKPAPWREVADLAAQKQHEFRAAGKRVGYTEDIEYNGKKYQLRVAPHQLQARTGIKIPTEKFESAKRRGFPLDDVGDSWLYAVEVYEKTSDPYYTVTRSAPAAKTPDTKTPAPKESGENWISDVWNFFTSLFNGGTPSPQPSAEKKENLEEMISKYVTMFGLASKSRPLTQMVVNAISNNELPHRDVLIKINSMHEKNYIIKYAEDLGNTLVSALDGDYSIHYNGNQVEISYKCSGEYDTIIPAIDAIAEIMSLSYLYRDRAIFKHSYRINKQSSFVKMSYEDLERVNRIVTIQGVK